MNKQLQIDLLKQLMHQLDNRQNVDAGVICRVPAEDYCNEDLAREERDKFFLKHPQLIGLSGDLPEPNSYLTFDDLGVPILATRDANGEFHCFVNACRHRGARVANERRGKRKNFICPFHAWNYSNTGDLKAIPQNDNFGEVDKACLGLTKLPCEEYNGQLWVHPDPNGRLDVTQFLGPLAEELSDIDFSRLVFTGEKTIEKDLNWKLANDTFGETYHFQKLHKDTLGNVFYGDALAYETVGKHHRFVFASKSIDLLRQVPEDEWELLHGATMLYYFFPNIQLNVSRSSIALIRIYPDLDKPGRSVTQVSHYFKSEYLELLKNQDVLGDDIHVIDKENVYMDQRSTQAVLTTDAIMEVFDSTIENEDYAVGEMTQKAAESGAIQHFVFGRNEAPLHHYHNMFRRELGRDELELVD